MSSQSGGLNTANKKSKHTREILHVLGLCILWYAISSSNNVIGKTVLNVFPYPMTMTMVQLLTITVLSGPVFNMWGVRPLTTIPWRYYGSIVVPLAVGKFLASVSAHVSIWKVPVSYAHTVKATMPLFTVVLSRLIMGEKQTKMIYLSLVPIIGGVAIATFTEISFDVIGLISALCSTMGFSLIHIFSKKVLNDTGVHHLRLLYLLGRLALFLFLPIWVFFDVVNLLNDSSLIYYDYKILGLLCVDGVLNWLQNIIAFSVLSLVTPLTYAVANASKRIFVIAISLFILGNPVTVVNVFGMLMAIFGVLLYNKAKFDAKVLEEKSTLLPFTHPAIGDYNNAIKNNVYSNHYNSISSNSISNNNNLNSKYLINYGAKYSINNPLLSDS